MPALKVYGYVRCSLQEQASDGLSLSAQRSRIEAWARATGAELADVIEDGGVSGTRRLHERPGGARIAELLSARRPSADAVAIIRLDRIGRDAAETLAVLRQFARGNVGLISIVDRIDLATPQGRAMAGVSAVFAELERALIAQRTAEAIGELRDRRRLYGPMPFGFEAVDGMLVQNPAEQRVLRRIARWRDDSNSYAAIAARLNSRRVPSKRGGRWYAMSVRSVLSTSARLSASEGPSPK